MTFSSVAKISGVIGVVLALSGCVGKTVYPYGGECTPMTASVLHETVSEVLTNQYEIHPGQTTCVHNIAARLENGEKILKVVTRPGDGIGNFGYSASTSWSDITPGNRRRFEVTLLPYIVGETKFLFEYSVRIAADNMFLEGNRPNSEKELDFKIFQLKTIEWDREPIFQIGVSQTVGMTVLGNVIQQPADIGKWIKITMRVKPSKRDNGFTKIWVDDKLIYDISNLANVAPKHNSNRYYIKFGIYQTAHLSLDLIPKNVQQSIEFKNIRFEKY